ncbi:MAG: four-carbon acid sugar kinase family protein [Spirochaetota bacterium]
MSSLRNTESRLPLRIAVLDDDPTGMQTIHGCLVLTQWDEEALRMAFDDTVRFFFVLTNTRAFGRDEATARVTEIAERVLRIAKERGERIVFVSRGDSTLRGHFPLEMDAIDAACERAGNGRAHIRLLVPAFMEGGRLTVDGVHYVVDGETRVPAAETEFSRDQVFGYENSDLRRFIEEKTRGAVSAESVRLVSVNELRTGSDGRATAERLDGLLGPPPERDAPGAAYVVSDAEGYEELEVLTAAVERSLARGTRILIQSAASFVKTLTHCPSIPLVSPETEGKGGIVIVGSYVAKTGRQLADILSHDATTGIEVDVQRVLADRDDAETLRGVCVARIQRAWEDGQTPVVFTSRREVRFHDNEQRLYAGRRISAFLVALLRDLGSQPAYIIAKGGITSNDLLVEGAGVSRVRVLGQVHPGVPILRIPDDYQLAGVPFVVFPGNVGDDSALTQVWRRFTVR